MSARQRQRGALLSVASLLGSLAVAEGVLRTQRPPRIQAVFPDQAELSVVDGEVFWRSHSRGEREREDCVAEEGGAKAVILGSSILFGVQLDFPDTLGAHLEPVLGGCVVNLAQPASSFSTQAATARSRLAALSPEIVIWEVWKNSPNGFLMLGDTAYNFGNLDVDETGVPSPFGLSSDLNRALFSRLALYRFAVLTQAADRPQGVGGARAWREFAETALAEMRELAGDARLILPMMPPLSVPFADSAARPPSGYVAFREEAARVGIETVDVAAAMAGEDHEALRLDPCCHLNAAGQAVLGQVLIDFFETDGSL